MLVKLFTLCIDISLGVALLLLATLVFDVIHVLLHRWAHSTNPLLARAGALHTVHHEFLDRDLRIHEEWMIANVFHHVVPEFIVQLLVTAALAPLFPIASVVTALLIECGAFAFIMWSKPGIDVNHKHVDQLKPYQPLYFCVPEYHLLHHVYPDAHFSSWIKTLDHWLGTGLSLRHRHVLMTDTHSPQASALAQALAAKGCVVQTLDVSADPSHVARLLHCSDILLLNHEGGGQSYAMWLEQFYACHQRDRIPVEVWEWYTDVSQRFAAYQRAREQFKLQRVIYRQLWSTGKQTIASVVCKLMRGLQRGDNVIRADSWF